MFLISLDWWRLVFSERGKIASKISVLATQNFVDCIVNDDDDVVMAKVPVLVVFCDRISNTEYNPCFQCGTKIEIKISARDVAKVVFCDRIHQRFALPVEEDVVVV
jgi:hypothetical protein